MKVTKESNFQSQLPQPNPNDNASLGTPVLKNDWRSSGSRIARWVGLKDLYRGSQAYRSKEYESARKSAALGFLKLGIIAAACYGVYKGSVGNIIHINDYLTQAEKDFQSQGNQPFVPSSGKNFIDSMYNEQKTFKTWPKAGRDFIAKHLKEDAPMSSAIIQHLIDREDITFEREAIRSCRDAPRTSKSCLTVLKAYTNGSHPYGLLHAMNLARSSRCKETPNAFCEKALENAKSMSLAKKSSPAVISLAKILTDPKSKADLKNTRDFIEKAANLFNGEIAEMQSAATDCVRLKEGDRAAGMVCYDRASRLKKALAWASWIVGKRAEWMKNYGAEQTIALQRDIKLALNGYVDFAKKVCQKNLDFEPCQRHVERSIEIYRTHRGLLEKSVDDCKEVNVTESAAWNRCYAHANIRDQYGAFRNRLKDSWKQEYVQKKDEELKDALQYSVSRLGVDLVEACANLPSAKACGGFADEIRQKQIDLRNKYNF
jgi:hypothetical protein